MRVSQWMDRLANLTSRAINFLDRSHHPVPEMRTAKSGLKSKTETKNHFELMNETIELRQVVLTSKRQYIDSAYKKRAAKTIEKLVHLEA